MSIFLAKLNAKIASSIYNDYDGNYDEDRFGKRRVERGIKELIRKRIRSSYIPKDKLVHLFKHLSSISDKYSDGFEILYQNLADDESKELLVELWAYRLLNNQYVKLKTNNPYYWKSLAEIKAAANLSEAIDPNFLHYKLHKFDLNNFGTNIQLFYTATGVLLDFFLEQYKYMSERTVIEANNGDIVIDAGGCCGDTALYFANKVGIDGKVFSFEFIPGNLEVFRINLNLNSNLAANIQLIENPVWSTSGKQVFFTNDGPSSKVSMEDFQGSYGSAYTLSIDDLVRDQRIEKVDFIKMDIEGAEPYALEGAKETIRRFKPNLAIAIYHSIDDFINIPKWIFDLNLGYKLYLGHYTIHQEETILFATTK